MKKILFVARDLSSSGVTTSMINYIDELSKNKDLKIDLLLDKNKGDYVNNISKDINIYEVTYSKEYFNHRLKLSDAKNKLNIFSFIIYFIIKILYIVCDKLFTNNIIDNYVIKKINNKFDKYDLIIDFEGYGYYLSKYVAVNFKDTKKIMFIHDEDLDWFNKVKNYLKCYDNFCCVSYFVKDKFIEKYPEMESKAIVIYNLIDTNKIIKLSKEDCELNKYNNVIKLCTVGRLAHQKGYDILIDSASILKSNNIDFKWFIIGNGYLEEELSKLIHDKELDNYVILMGLKKNPYPYIKNCDIYVQTSRHEGFGITIAEAKILNKAIVSTNLGSIREQIDNNVNGLLCNIDSTDIASSIMELIKDKNKIKLFENNLKKFKFSNKEQIDKLISLID